MTGRGGVSLIMNPSFQSVAMHRFGGSVDKRRAREPATGEGGASKYLSLFGSGTAPRRRATASTSTAPALRTGGGGMA